MYAEWLSESLDCDIKEDTSLSDIAGYNTIICGGVDRFMMNMLKKAVKKGYSYRK